MEYFFWSTLPSLIAILISVWILGKSCRRNLLKSNLYLAVFFIGIMGPNLIELLTLSGLVAPNLLFMKLYYAFMVFALGSVFLLAASLSGLESIRDRLGKLTRIVYGTAALFAVVIMATELIIAGHSVTTYTVTRVPGDFYLLVQAYFFITLAASIGYLLLGALNPANETTRKRCKIILLSFSPMILSLLAVVVLMQSGFHVNATFVLPLGTAFLLLALVSTESQEDLFKLLLRLPYTSERKSYRVMISEIEDFLTNTSTGRKASLKTLTSSLEQHIVCMAVDISNGSQIQAASLLNTSASSICRKIRSQEQENEAA